MMIMIPSNILFGFISVQSPGGIAYRIRRKINLWKRSGY